MSEQSAGHLLVQCLIEQGVEVTFGVPGESFLDVLDGFHAFRDRIKFVACRQEGGAAFMAEAHGKLTRRPGVCIVTRGPGATNASIGVHTAFQDSTPMILLVGDVGGDFRDREAFQEVDFAAMFGPNTKGMAKLVERIDRADRIPEYVQRAFSTAMSGRPGPVVLVMPEDMLTERTAACPAPRVEPVSPGVAAKDVQSLLALLRKAERPLLIAGGGWSASSAQALQRFAERWQLPVGNAFRFQDSFDNHHGLYAGDIGIGVGPKLAQRVRDSDLIIAVGARLGEMTTSGYTLLDAPRPRQKLVHVHSGAEELYRVYSPDLAINASNASLMDALAEHSPVGQVPWKAWADQAHRDYEAHTSDARRTSEQIDRDDTARGPIDMAAVVQVVQRLLPADAVVTNGAGNFASWIHRYFRFHGIAKGVKTQLSPTAGAMGYGVPAGIAANLITGRVAFTIAGDGDFLMNGQELATAIQYGARSIIVVLNNGIYGTIRMHQERHYPGHVIGTDLRNPDFVMLAKAYGYVAEKVERTSEFEPALRRALQSDRGTLIEIPLSPQMITTGPSLEDIRKDAMKRLCR
ncbi:thiamine pyrophosphate-binding protein [Variovorax ureilyticus]|uniref:Thiamine pyrophosphate-binding protein n=1 Tax=Variovorax ureilyticus TaxID=1836198 RepID=A0ABU8VM23_9BURK